MLAARIHVEEMPCGGNQRPFVLKPLGHYVKLRQCHSLVVTFEFVAQ